MTVWIESELCDGCERCLRACPYDAIEMAAEGAGILDRCTACGACISACRNGAILSDARPREIPDFSDYAGVWVFAEQRQGELARVTLELLGKAQALAKSLDQKVSVVLLGSGIAPLTHTLFKYGAEEVFLADHKILEAYRPESYTRVIQDLIQAHQPNIFLIGATHIGRDLAPRIARQVGSGLTADCTDLTIDKDDGLLLQTRPAFGGNVMAVIVNRYSRPQMATVRPGVMQITERNGGQGVAIDCPVSVKEEHVQTRVLDVVMKKKKSVDLTEAGVIVAGGRGVGGAAGFELLRELADVLDGQVAGTRVAVEEAWITAEHQVGQTGKTVRPDIYIACGISGAVQHRAGMMNSKYIIAVNPDSRAPIFKIADWGIVGDFRVIIPEMIKQFKNRKQDITWRNR